MKAPCKDCTERAAGCHSNCEKYIAFTEELKKARQNKEMQRIIKDYSPNKKARVRKYEIHKMSGRGK